MTTTIMIPRFTTTEIMMLIAYAGLVATAVIYAASIYFRKM